MKRIYIPNRYELSLYTIAGNILGDLNFFGTSRNIMALIDSQVLIESEVDTVSAMSLLNYDSFTGIIDRL